jgi:hypothetical protein
MLRRDVDCETEADVVIDSPARETPRLEAGEEAPLKSHPWRRILAPYGAL